MSDEKFKLFFLQISKTCEAVICCRVSPGQKADVVRLIKSDDDDVITLAIGDGANDVSMIKEAHIGIGLYGNEGMRAVQSSDFALGEFKFLWRLILHHGRLCYLRNSELILYFFYKNLVMTVPHIYFAFTCGFSGQTVFDDYYISFYNLFFTSWPLLIKAAFEQDVNYQIEGEAIRKLYPSLYYIGQKRSIFNWSNYFSINFLGLFHSVFIYYIPYYVLHEHHILNSSGQSIDIWSVSVISFTCLFCVVTAKLVVWTRYWTKINFFFYSIMSIFVYIVYMWFSNYWTGSRVAHSIVETHMSPFFYLCILLCGVTTFLVDYGYEFYRFNYAANASDLIRKLVYEKKGAGFNNEDVEIEITDQDYKQFRASMLPIEQSLREEDLKYEELINQKRYAKKLKSEAQHQQ
jgi:magnesium-transporting ATPase (P-type)